jgi:ribose transport system permease protein
VSTRDTTAGHGRGALGQRTLRALGPRNIGAVYILAVIVLFFSLYTPEFFTWGTVQQVFNNYSITGLIALSLIIPLATSTFDLSVGWIASLSGVVTAYFIAHGVGVWGAVALGVGSALLVGLINAIVVVVMGVDSFIGTLATGSLITAFITLVTNDIAINDPKLGGTFTKVAQTEIGGTGLTLPVVYTLVVALLIWFVLEHTVTGRRFYAVGFNAEAARLAGVNVNRLRFISLLVSAGIAGIAGIVLASNLANGSPRAGASYLLAAFAVAFLGATQLRGGRFNAWGTIIALLMLAFGTVGIGLSAWPLYVPDMFTGVVLIAALAITASGRQGRSLLRRLAHWRRRRSADHEAPPTTPASEVAP